MNGHHAYRRSLQISWTRIEMLLALYDGVLSRIDEGIELIESNKLSDYPEVQLKVIKLLLMLVDGLDPAVSPIAANVQQLVAFSLGKISQTNASDWRSAKDVLSTLRSGFFEIREQGIELEKQGAIAPISSGHAQSLIQG